MTTCPKCGTSIDNQTSCPGCGVIFAKMRESEDAGQAAAEKRAATDKAKKQAESRLVHCAACHAEISKTAKQCPRCGEKRRVPVGRATYIISGLILAVVLVLISVDAERVQEKQAATNKFLADNPEILHRRAARGLCDARLRTGLRDPESLVINEVTQNYSPATAAARITVLTGYEIRAKNGFGGYVGSSHICTVEIDQGNATLTDFIKVGN